jgi:hypothetical protein
MRGHNVVRPAPEFDIFAECNKDVETMVKKAPWQNNVLLDSLAVHHVSCKLWPFHAGGGCPGLTCATGIVPSNIDGVNLGPCRLPTGWTDAS